MTIFGKLPKTSRSKEPTITHLDKRKVTMSRFQTVKVVNTCGCVFQTPGGAQSNFLLTTWWWRLKGYKPFSNSSDHVTNPNPGHQDSHPNTQSSWPRAKKSANRARVICLKPVVAFLIIGTIAIGVVVVIKNDQHKTLKTPIGSQNEKNAIEKPEQPAPIQEHDESKTQTPVEDFQPRDDDTTEETAENADTSTMKNPVEISHLNDTTTEKTGRTSTTLDDGGATKNPDEAFLREDGDNLGKPGPVLPAQGSESYHERLAEDLRFLFGNETWEQQYLFGNVFRCRCARSP